MNRFCARLSTISVLAVVGIAASPAAQAAPTSPAVLARVSVSDLDLSRPDDARLFQARVDAASEAVCQARTQAQRLDRFSAKACRLDVQDEVLSKLSRRQTRALHASGR